MTTTVIDRKTALSDHVSELFGTSHTAAVQQPDRIDPADYDNDTDYLNAIPGMAESIINSMNAPMSEFEDIPRNRNNRNNV